jgi:hypothetical protein
MKKRPARPLLHDRPQFHDDPGFSMRLTLRRPSGATVRFGFFFALVAWAMAVGKDVSWDVVNHHLYLPFSWITGRYRTDLFGAGGQAYQNPLGYFPFYAMVRMGLPAWTIGVILSAVHALVVWPLDRIARLFWPTEGEQDFWCRVLALALCCIAPIFLMHEGSTSIDPFASLMIVWALALTLESGSTAAAHAGNNRRAALAGALVGLASAIKLSNAVLAVALCALWLMKWLLGQVDFRRLAAVAAGLLVAFAAGAGWWMAWLWQDFGNPIFPLFNNVFHSPYAPQQAITALRFVPTTLWGMVARLGEMAEFSNFVAFELIMPDFRPVIAAGVAVLAAIVLAARGGWRNAFKRLTWSTPGVQIAVFVALSYVLWLRSSGNARYAIALFVILGIPLVRATQRALPFSATKILLLTLLILQGASYGFQSPHRFSGAPWDAGPYLDYQVPRRLREEPYLHLAVGTQSNAALALFLAPGGALSNPIGNFPISPDGPLGERFQALLKQWHGRTRVLFVAPSAIDPADIQHVQQAAGALLYRLGLDIDWSDCESIKLLAARYEDRAWATNDGLRPDRERDLRSCGVIYRTDRDQAADEQLVAANKVFAIMEAACPGLFSPTPFASEHNTGTWQRRYLNTEAELTVSVREGVTMAHFRMMRPTYFGSIDDVLNHRVPIKCPRIEYQTPK